MDMMLLKKEEVVGEVALEVIRNYGEATAATDLAIILGGDMDVSVCRTAENDRSGGFWTMSCDSYCGTVHCINFWHPFTCGPRAITPSIRPVLPASEAFLLCPNAVRELRLKNGKTVKIAEWGEYPQTIASEAVSRKLEAGFQNEKLSQTGKKYTLPSTVLSTQNIPFNQLQKYPEYELGGKRHIRIEADLPNSDECSVLSNGHHIKFGEICWVEVRPIEWLIDEKTGKWISKKSLLSGVPFDTKPDYMGDFDKTNIKSYMDTHLSKEILQPSRAVTRTAEMTELRLAASGARERG